MKLDLAVSPNTWLMPSRMVINTESVVGYNNQLKRASHAMKLGVNPDINMVIKDVGVRHNLGRSKVIFPHAEVVRRDPFPRALYMREWLSKTRRLRVPRNTRPI